jgi:ribosomal protein S27AE
MPATRAKMRCPKCGAQMNAHAEKLMITADSAEPGFDPYLGGVIEETNACPNCGNVATRRAI